MKKEAQQLAVKIYLDGYKKGYEEAWAELVCKIFNTKAKYVGHCPSSNLDWAESCLINGFKSTGKEADIKTAEEIKKMWKAMNDENES